MENKQERKMVSKAVAAAMLGISASTVERLIKNGTLKAIKIGPKLVKIDEKEIERIANGGANE